MVREGWRGGVCSGWCVRGEGRVCSGMVCGVREGVWRWAIRGKEDYYMGGLYPLEQAQHVHVCHHKYEDVYTTMQDGH